VLDEAKWGTPRSAAGRERATGTGKISEALWRETVKQKGEGRREEVRFDLWLPKGLAVARRASS
jgi:hypothetical protein